MNALRTTLAAAAIVAVAGIGYAQTSHHGHGGMATTGAAPAHVMDPVAMQKMMDAMMPSPGDPPSTKDLKAADMRMMHAMAVGYTGDADVDFRTHMIPHHQGAIDMAKVALNHAKDPDTKKMAEAIIKDQEREIGEMQAWLKMRGK